MENIKKNILGTALLFMVVSVMFVGFSVDNASAASASASFGKIKTVCVEKSSNGNLYMTATYAVYDAPLKCTLTSYGSKSFSGVYTLYSINKKSRGVYKIPRQKVVSGRSYGVRLTYDGRSCATPKIKVPAAKSLAVGQKKTVFRN